MKPLVLSGRAQRIIADSACANHQVLRLVEAAPPSSARDAILVRGQSGTASGHWPVAICIDEDGPAVSADCIIRLGSEFNYLAAGDVVGVHLSSRRFRTLYRRNSRHNSFLTTERCNHYCLMCSQPPKSAD